MPYLKLKPFSFGRKEVNITGFTGRIVGSSKRSETHITHTSGTTYTNSVTGTVETTPGSTSSSTVVKQEFFLRDDQGSEVPYQLSGVDLPVHDGQTVTMISADTVNGKWHWYERLVVHDTGKWYSITDAGPSKLGLVRSRWSVTKRSLAIIIGGGFIVAPLTGYAGAPSVAVGGLGLLFFIWGLVYWPRGWMRYGRASSQFETHLNALCSEAFRSMHSAPITERPVEVVEREVLKIPCKFCGNLIDPIRDTKCPSCGANITLGEETRAVNSQAQGTTAAFPGSRFCSSCGAPVAADATFCPKCGGRLGN